MVTVYLVSYENGGKTVFWEESLSFKEAFKLSCRLPNAAVHEVQVEPDMLELKISF